jgi:hypothetical protein
MAGKAGKSGGGGQGSGMNMMRTNNAYQYQSQPQNQNRYQYRQETGLSAADNGAMRGERDKVRDRIQLRDPAADAGEAAE